MTKNLDNAIALMENGWCRGDLKEKGENGRDRYCAVGAVTEAAGLLVLIPVDEIDLAPGETLEDAAYWVDEYETYSNFNNLPEARVLAEVIFEDEEWMEDRVAWGERRRAGEEWDEVVFTYNDDHDKDKVIEVFKKAKERMSVGV